MSKNHGSVPQPEVSITDVIREHKSERKLKAETKRQADLQRIRDMSSATGIDPLQRFPKEIWLKIIDELDPEDRWNMWQLHPLFRDLMKTNRIRDILLPLILKVKDFQNEIGYFIHKEEPLRLISKSSRNCFDGLMEVELKNRIHEWDAHSAPLYEDVLSPMLGYDDEDDRGIVKLQLLLKNFDMEKNPGKRFYRRGLGVFYPEYCGTEDGPHPHRQHLQDIVKLLNRIGNDIWIFRILMEDVQQESLAEVYVLFHEMICLMPNLKWLEVLIKPKIINETTGGRKKRVNRMSMLVPQSILERHKFPRLNHLERLTLYPGKSEGFNNIYVAILAANQHVKILDVSVFVPSPLTRSLQLTGFAVSDDYSPTLSSIRSIVNCNWPLKKIVLDLCSDPMTDDSLVSVFQFLEKFPTLEQARLCPMEGLSFGDEDNFGYLNLPNLREFSFELTSPEIDYDSRNTHFFFSLQFMVHCKKLEQISWDLSDFNDMELRGQLKKYELANCGKVVGFRAGLRILYDSNLWKVFPSLSRISVRNEREGADHSCKHEYYRTRAMEGVSHALLLKLHDCSRYWFLPSCTALFD